jgi:hypothetical protein
MQSTGTASDLTRGPKTKTKTSRNIIKAGGQNKQKKKKTVLYTKAKCQRMVKGKVVKKSQNHDTSYIHKLHAGFNGQPIRLFKELNDRLG